MEHIDALLVLLGPKIHNVATALATSYAVSTILRMRYKKLFLFVLFLIIICAVVKVTLQMLLAHIPWRRFATYYIDYFRQPYHISLQNVQSAFANVDYVYVGHVNGHTHAASASTRNVGREMCFQVVRSLGKEPYSYQRSTADERQGIAGNREYFWDTDLKTRYSNVSFDSKKHILCIFDTDQYVDMPALLAKHNGPVLISTFTPNAVAYVGVDYSFVSDSNNVFEYRVAGGACYRGKAWNWNLDSFFCFSYTFGVPIACTAYHVSRRSIDPHHQIILLAPMGHWSHTGGLLKLLNYHTLEYLNVNHGDFNRLEVITEGEVLRSTSRPMSHDVVTCTALQDDKIATMCSITRDDINLGQVAQILKADKDAGAVLVAYHRHVFTKKNGSHPDRVYPVGRGIKHFQPVSEDYDPSTDKPMMVPYCSPLINEAYVPVSCLANEREAAVERVTKLVEENKDIALTPYMTKIIDNLVVLIAPTAGILHPVEEDVVFEKQNSPSQRAILKQAVNILQPDHTTRSFIKAAAGPEGVARLITEPDKFSKLHLAQFIYPFSEYMYEMPWYAFSRTPAEIAQRVAEIASRPGTTHIICSDYSKWDGRFSHVLMEFMRRLMLRLFHQSYHDLILNYLRNATDLVAYTHNGFRYELVSSLPSGRQDTSVSGTSCNALIAFTAFMNQHVDGRARTHAEAYQCLIDNVFCGGDDGIVANVSSDSYVKAAKMWGQKLKAEVISHGSLGVKFLSRYYSPLVWYGDPDSCCDIRKQISKFHVTVRLQNVTPEQKFIQKMRGYAASDYNTPIIGEIARAATGFDRSVLTSKQADRRITSYTTLTRVDYGQGLVYEIAPESVQYPNRNTCDWMEDVVNLTLGGFNRERLRRHIQNSRSLEMLMRFPLCQPDEPAAPTRDIIVDGEPILVTSVQPVAKVSIKALRVEKPVKVAKPDNRRAGAKNGNRQ